jgi:hypothetical protein
MSQCTEILKYLQSGRKVTPLMALGRWGCFRLAGRILELRDRGHTIRTDIVEVGRKRIATYALDHS